MPTLHLSTEVSWHARGEAAFSWHRVTGDVCEMSRDVVALCLAFAGGAEVDTVAVARPGGIAAEEARAFVAVLAGRDLLVPSPSPSSSASPLGAYRPYVPRLAVFLSDGDDIIACGRAATLRVNGVAAALARADGTRPLAELAAEALWPSLRRLVEPDLALLKLLPPGHGVPRWAESTMPWPEVDPRAFAAGVAARDPADLAGYHAAIGDAEAQFDEVETTLSHLFRAPHPALGGEAFGARLAKGLIARGARPSGARIIETGGGLGWVGRALVDALAPASYVIIDRSPRLAGAQRQRGLMSVVGDALRLPIADASVDLVISNEMAGDLGTVDGVNTGALALVEECARVLAPGGLAYLSEFGHPSQPPRKSDHLDHDEYSLRFNDLRTRAAACGLDAQLVPLPRLIGLDGRMRGLVSTRMSYAALRTLVRSRGGELPKRAWLEEELHALLRQLGIDPGRLHGLVCAPIGERTMGLVPGEFWALLATRPG